ncbi:MAG: hypothetical protein GY938_32930, partial [Ketobacter sp.]|nr:hypothetical protein [Ketobacter sp.]
MRWIVEIIHHGATLVSAFQFTCTTEWGPNSTTAEGNTSDATCPNGTSIVSCGIDNTKWDTDFLQRGVSHTADEKCRATNGDAGGTVRAVARCCTMPEDTTICSGQNTGSGASDDGDTTNETCSSGYMTGCAVHSDGGSTKLDGAWPGDPTFSFLNNGAGYDRTTIGAAGFENVDVNATNHVNKCTAVDG